MALEIALCSVAVPFNDQSNVFCRIYKTYNALYGILPSGIVGCISSRWMCVFGYIAITVACLYLNVSRYSVLVGVRWRACCSFHGIVLEMPSLLIVRVCGCTNTTRNGPNACVSILLYVVFAIAFANWVAAADSSGRSTSTSSPGVNVGVTRASFLQPRLHRCRLACICFSALDCGAYMRASNALRVVWTEVLPESSARRACLAEICVGLGGCLLRARLTDVVLGERRN